MKKISFSCEASTFDESYASPGHNGKKSWFLPRGVKEQAKKLFSAAPSFGCAIPCGLYFPTSRSVLTHRIIIAAQRILTETENIIKGSDS